VKADRARVGSRSRSRPRGERRRDPRRHGGGHGAPRGASLAAQRSRRLREGQHRRWTPRSATIASGPPASKAGPRAPGPLPSDLPPPRRRSHRRYSAYSSCGRAMPGAAAAGPPAARAPGPGTVSPVNPSHPGAGLGEGALGELQRWGTDPRGRAGVAPRDGHRHRRSQPPKQPCPPRRWHGPGRLWLRRPRLTALWWVREGRLRPVTDPLADVREGNLRNTQAGGGESSGLALTRGAWVRGLCVRLEPTAALRLRARCRAHGRAQLTPEVCCGYRNTATISWQSI